jgi:hypothetical protein
LVTIIDLVAGGPHNYPQTVKSRGSVLVT